MNAAQNKPDQIIKTMAENSSIFIKESLSPTYCTLKPKNTNSQPRYLAHNPSHTAQISMHFDFNNQFIKVKRTLTKISKTTKILFCFVLISGFMNLYVKHILDIKKVFYFDDLKQLGFLPDKIKISLQRRIFLEP